MAINRKHLAFAGGFLGTAAVLGAFAPKIKKAIAAPTTSSNAAKLAAAQAAKAKAANDATQPMFADYPKTATVSTTSSSLNVRKDSNENSEVVTKVSKGSKVSVTGPMVKGDNTQSKGWAPVLTSAGPGFVSANFLQF